MRRIGMAVLLQFIVATTSYGRAASLLQVSKSLSRHGLSSGLGNAFTNQVWWNGKRCIGSTTIATTTATTTMKSTGADRVEISPTNHGTTPITSLVAAVADDDDNNKRLQKYLQTNGLTRPTPIQAHSIPLLKNGHDVMASAQTGSGKTLMFALPLCQTVSKNSLPSSSSSSSYNNNNNIKQTKKPTAIVLNPTRELAMQTHGVIHEMTERSNLRIGLVVGGMHGMTRDELRRCDILVATPGRLLQYVDERVLSLRDNIRFVVIDEADRMLDLGFEPQLRRIARALGRPRQQQQRAQQQQQQQQQERAQPQQQHPRQTVLCSATFPPAVQRLAAEFLRPNYYFVAAGKVGGTHDRIQQELIWANNPTERESMLVEQVNEFLKSNNKQSSVVVFCCTKERAERIGKMFGKRCRVVTGDKTQKERNQSLQIFRQGRVPVLVATDVAARGLHVENIGLVVQADAPREVDTWVHRIGRTGRAGATGQAIGFLDGRSIGIAADLVDLLRDADQTIPPWLVGMAYVSRAKYIEEKEAIAVGGGANGAFSSVRDQKKSDEDGDGQSENNYSPQDFRRDAEAGSWGSDRDVTYHEFDEEAYSSLEEMSTDVIDQTRERLDRATFVNEGKSNRDAAHENDTMDLFQKQPPSERLCHRFQKETGRTDVTHKPDRHFYQLLSKDRDPKLKYEYLGMFPFSKILPLLSRDIGDRGYTDKSSDLPTVLMVAEKPSIAKAVAEALSGPKGPRQRRGISKALPVYEFTTNKFIPEEDKLCRIKVTSVVGHVFSLAFVENGEESRDAFTDPSEFFHLPVVKKEELSAGKLRVVDHLRALAAESDHLVLWLDCDAEGENIAHEVIGVTRKALEMRVAQNHQEIDRNEVIRRVHRARFSAITKDAIHYAFSSLVEPDAELSRSVDARQELDLRVGVSMTRLLNWRCIGLARKHFSPATKLISYGPCQTPALSFCVDRAKEIESFHPESFHYVDISCILPDKPKETFSPRWVVPVVSSGKSHRMEETKFVLGESSTFDKALAEMAVKTVLDAGKLTVRNVTEVKETRHAPFGLNTVALLTSASKAMGLSPKQVMNVAEKLYSSGFISYPRTETTRYDPTGFDVRLALREHQSHPEWGRTASYLLQTKYSKSGRPPLRGNDAGDHPPITPLKAATRNEVGGGNPWRVYDFITRNFLGSLSDDLRYTRLIAELGVDCSDSPTSPTFELVQTNVDSLGFAGVCRWALNDIGASPKVDHRNVVFFKGMQFQIKGAQSIRRLTKPPTFLQEHELVQLMDKNGIGTDASLATHINNIVDRGYVVLCDETGAPIRPFRPPRPGQPQPVRQVGRYMVPTSLGMSVIDLFADTEKHAFDPSDDSLPLLAQPAIRAQMEAEVKQIAIGKMNKEECLSKNLKWFEARYHGLFNALNKRRIEQFGRSLRQTKESLNYWRSRGAFLKAKPQGLTTKRYSKNNRSETKQKSKRKGTGVAKRRFHRE